MRFNAQTVTIENGFVYLPSAAPWLAEFVREIITFPASKYDDQTDSTSQELAWLNSQPPGPGIIGFYRRENALRMRANGDSIEKIAGFLKSTPEEVQRWFKEDAERNVRMQAIVDRRYIRNCEKCGKEILPNIQYTEAGGDAYHDECCANSLTGNRPRLIIRAVWERAAVIRRLLASTSALHSPRGQRLSG